MAFKVNEGEKKLREEIKFWSEDDENCDMLWIKSKSRKNWKWKRIRKNQAKV